MKLLGYLMLACVVLAALKMAVAALLAALAVGLLWWAITAPRELAGAVCLLLVANLIQSHGLAFAGVLALALIVRAIQLTRGVRPSVPRLSLLPPR